MGRKPVTKRISEEKTLNIVKQPQQFTAPISSEVNYFIAEAWKKCFLKLKTIFEEMIVFINSI